MELLKTGSVRTASGLHMWRCHPRGKAEVWTHHFVVGHQLEDAGCHPAPKLQCRQDRCEAELILTLDVCSYGTLFAIHSPELSKDKRMEEGTHVQHGGLKRNRKKSCYILVGCAVPHALLAWLWPSQEHSPRTAKPSDPRPKEFAPRHKLVIHHLKTSRSSLGQWECA